MFRAGFQARQIEAYLLCALTQQDLAVSHARFDITRHPVSINNSLFPCVRSEQDIQRISRLKNQVVSDIV